MSFSKTNHQKNYPVLGLIFAVIMVTLLSASECQAVTLTISANNGSVTATPAKADYSIGEVVELIPKPDTGYYFTGWAGDARGKRLVLNLTMDSNKTITANFDTWQPPIGVPEPEFGIFETYRMYDNPANRNPALTYTQNAEGGYYTHYVDKDDPAATDTGNTYGTIVKPRKTIPEAVPAGSVVEIHGTYTNPAYIIRGDGTAGQPVFYRGISDERPTFLGILYPQGSYVIVENLYFYTTRVGFRVYSAGGLPGPVEYISFRNNEIEGDGTSRNDKAIFLNSADAEPVKHDIVFYNNHIHHWGDYNDSENHDGGGFAVTHYTEKVWIVDNHIHHTGGDGFIVDSSTANHLYIGRNIMHNDRENAFDIKACSDVIISQNEMYGYLTTEPYSSDGQAIRVNNEGEKENIWIIFNTIYDSVRGIDSLSSPCPPYVIGNVIYDCDVGLYNGAGWVINNTVYNTGIGVRVGNNIINNIIYNCSTSHLHAGNNASYNLLWQDDEGPITLVDIVNTNGIEADPLFVDPANCDFFLQADSPAIDAGISSGVVQQVFDTFQTLYGIDIRKDIEGISRPQGLAWDIGAFEYFLNAVTDLAASGTSQNSVTVSWTMPSDDGLASMPSRYDIRYATSLITEANWGTATQVQGEPVPEDFGVGRSFTISGLNPGTTYYIAIKTSNETGSTTSALSNVISGTTATSGNFAPVMELIGDKTAMHEELLTFVINATDNDVGDTLTYSATGLPLGASFNTTTHTFAWTPTISQGGTYHVTFQVTDSSVAVMETITIGLSQPPVLAAIGNKSVSEGSLLSFTISATDAEGDAITYSATGLPAGAAFVGRTFSWTPGYTQAGTHNVTFIASDGVAQDSETITITVNNTNRAPVLDTIGDKFANESTLLTFGISATEPDGQAVTYSAAGLPAGATFAGQTFTWTPSSSNVGNNYPVTFTASDGQLSDSETVYITVMSDNTAPSVSNLSPAANSIQAPLNSLIILHVTDAGIGVDAGTVTISLDGGTIYTGDTSDYSSATGNCRRAGTPTDFTYAYQSSQIFDFDQSKTVTVNAVDLFGNVMAQQSYSFRTEMRSFSQNIRVDTTVQGINKAAPSTAQDSSGNIWAVWHAGPAGSRNIYVAKLRADRNTFSASVRLTSSIADQANPALALGTDDKLYVAWQDKRNGDWDIYSSTSLDGVNWTTQTRVNDPNEGNQINPAIVVDSRTPNYAYVVWQDDRAGNQDICIASSSNSFGTKTVAQITSNTANQTTPAIAVNSANTVYVLWTDARNATNDIYGAAGSPWTNVPIVTKAGSQYNPVIAVESAGTILHMLWVDQISGNSDIYYASSNGLPGSPLTGTNLIDDTLGKEQISPAIAVTGSTGNNLEVFACWHDERNISDSSGDTDLYMVQTNSGVGTNVFVGDGDTNSDQIEPAMNTDQYGYPYLVWTDDRSANTEIYFAGSVYLQSIPLVSELTTASVGGTVGTDPASITDAEDVSVVVPAGACPYDVTISITKIEYQHEYGSLPFLNGYDFGPSGMTFNTPVTVTIPYVVTGDAGRPTVYWYDSRAWYNPLSQQGITNIETIVITSSLHALRFKTTHFTPFYILLGAAIYTAADTASSSDGGGGGGGGGCSLSHSQDGSILEYFLPYGALALFMFIFKWRDRRYRKDFDKTPLS